MASTRGADGRSRTASRDKGRKTVQVTVAKGGATVATDSTDGVRRSQARRRPDWRHRRSQRGDRRRGPPGLEHVPGQHHVDPLLPIADIRPAQHDSQHALDLADATPDESDSAPPTDQATEVAGDLLAAATPIPSESAGAAAGLPMCQRSPRMIRSSRSPERPWRPGWRRSSRTGRRLGVRTDPSTALAQASRSLPPAQAAAPLMAVEEVLFDVAEALRIPVPSSRCSRSRSSSSSSAG